MKDVNNQAAALAKEIFVQLDSRQQKIVNSIANTVNSVKAQAFITLSEEQAKYAHELDVYLEEDRKVIVNREEQLSWPHPVALPKQCDDEVFVSWIYNEDRRTYVPRQVYLLLTEGSQVKSCEFGLTRLMSLWQCAFRKAIRKPTEKVMAESCVSRLQETLVGLERRGIKSEAISRHAKSLISELNKVSK